MSAERFTLDTNILVYAVDAREGRKREFAKHIIEAAVGLDCLLALQVVGEFYAAATTKLKLDAKDAAVRAAYLIAGSSQKTWQTAPASVLLPLQTRSGATGSHRARRRC